MAKDHTSKSELEVKINITDDPDDLLAMYRGNRGFFQEIISRLLSLKMYSHFSTVWSEASDMFNKDPRSLTLALISVRCNARELCHAEETDFLVRSLLDLALQHSNTFETLKICQTVSELIVQNRQFPSKAMATLYFRTISALFKAGNNICSYLNALHFLNELEPMSIKKGEFEFLKELAMMKSETFARDLFCGIKPRETSSISVGLEDAETALDEKLCGILDAFKAGNSIENSFSNVAFLLKHSIPFAVERDIIKFQRASHEGFTSVVFGIANQYVPEVAAQEPSIQAEVSVEKKKTTVTREKEEAAERTKPRTEFKNRFTVEYKKSKLFKMHMSVEFDDVHYNERNSRRERLNSAQMDERMREREFLLPYKDVVEGLVDELRRLQEEKASNERQVLLEKAKAEEEKSRQEQRSRMWRAQDKKEQPALEPLENKSSANFTDGKTDTLARDGIYVPKFSTLNYTSSNIPEMAEKATEGARIPSLSSYRKDIGKKELDKKEPEGSWRKKRQEHTKN